MHHINKYISSSGVLLNNCFPFISLYFAGVYHISVQAEPVYRRGTSSEILTQTAGTSHLLEIRMIAQRQKIW